MNQNKTDNNKFGISLEPEEFSLISRIKSNAVEIASHDEQK